MRAQEPAESAVPAGRSMRHGALLLALIAHGAVGGLIATSGDNKRSANDAVSPRVLTVRMVQADAERRQPRGAVNESIRTPVLLPASTAPSDGQQKARRDEALVSVTQPVGPHYFRLSELTQKPALVHDAIANLVLHVPGLPPQPVILRLLINDEGQVDSVVVEDSFLGRDVEQYVTDAFAKVRFHPGRIGRIAVRSQMRVEAWLESMEYRQSAALGSSG